ncbi:TPA: LOW QUALITY PROTEIN: hypothetical protein N0F65_011713, partial [Lagenidium giganteum]
TRSPHEPVYFLSAPDNPGVRQREQNAERCRNQASKNSARAAWQQSHRAVSVGEEEFGLWKTPNPCTINNILRIGDGLDSVSNSPRTFLRNRKRVPKLKVPELVRCLEASNEWLDRFKKRNNIRAFILHGEDASTDEDTAAKAADDLKKLTALYDPNNIFNCDEAGLFYEKVADAERRSSLKKKSRISILFACNATGTEKLTPYFIGRSQRPHCFQSKSPKDEGYQYGNNKCAWITWEIFQAYLLVLDATMRAQDREYLPPNTTSRLQSLDAGVIAAIKSRHQRKMLALGLRLDDLGWNEPCKVNLRTAMEWVVDVWEETACEGDSKLLETHEDRVRL